MERHPISGSGSGSSSFADTVGDGTSNPIAVTHGLGTEDVEVSARMSGGGKQAVDIAWGVTDADTITIYPDVVVAAGSLRVLVRS